jgi:hypothetical protein
VLLFRKRQQSGHKNFVVAKRSYNIEGPDARFLVSDSVLSGSWMLQETESTDTGVTTSFELEGAWEVFPVSAGVSVNSSPTVQSAVGITINVNCSGQGVVLWAPLHDYYKGYFEPRANLHRRTFRPVRVLRLIATLFATVVEMNSGELPEATVFVGVGLAKQMQYGLQACMAAYPATSEFSASCPLVRGDV